MSGFPPGHVGLDAALAPRFDALYQWLDRRYGLIADNYEVAGHSLRIYRIRDIDAVLEQTLSQQADPDSHAPYWSEIWPSALALSEFLRYNLRFDGQQLIELGCGGGLTGLAVADLGGTVRLSDKEEDALKLAELNWLANYPSPPAIERLDWLSPPANQRYDVILAADVAYERRLFLPLLNTLDALLSENGTIWLSEPGRPVSALFFELLQEEQLLAELQEKRYTAMAPATSVSIYKITRR